MSAPTHIPAHTRVEGRIETSSDLEIEGRCDGDIVVGGSVVVRPGAVCKARVRARSATIQGEIIGDVVCTESIVLAAGARVAGDLRAPDVSVDPSAKLDGKVDLFAPDPEDSSVRRMSPHTRGPKPRRPAPPEATATPAVPRPPRPRGRTRVTQRALETEPNT